MKTCSKCGETKETNLFPPDNRNPSGRSSLCRACSNELTRAWRSSRPAEERRAYDNSYHNSRKQDPNYLDKRKAARTKLRYGITLEEVEQMRLNQNDACKICEATGKRLVIDHCHETGEVRGLLCYSCNIRLAGLENTLWRNRALAYLGVRT